jgi:hypothetical protein
MRSPISAVLDLVMLPVRAGQAVTRLPGQLLATVDELGRLRREIEAARIEAFLLRGRADALIGRSDDVVARLTDLVGIGPHLLDSAVTTAEDLQLGVDELERARAALIDLGRYARPDDEPAVVRTLGLVD